MAAQNRAAKITKLVTALKKQYKPVAPTKERTLLETLLFACLLENSPYEIAEQVFTALEDGFFDWNEVRVTTNQELAEVCKPLHDAGEAATRLKGTLQSLFETFYSFDIESMKKQNLGASVQQLTKLPGTTRFIVAYAAQNSLGGHSIPVNDGLLVALKSLDVITDAEAAAGTVPGLERAVPKNKGVEVGSLLHQLGAEIGKNPFGQPARKRLLAIDPKCKDRLPKRPPKPAPEPEPEPEKKPAKAPPEKAKSKPDAAKKSAPEKKAAPAKAAPSKKAPAKSAAKPAPAKKGAAKKTEAKKKVVKKKVAKKKVAKKKTAAPAKGKKAKKVVKKSAVKKGAKKPAGKIVKKKKKKVANKRKPR